MRFKRIPPNELQGKNSTPTETDSSYCVGHLISRQLLPPFNFIQLTRPNTSIPERKHVRIMQRPRQNAMVTPMENARGKHSTSARDYV